MKISSLAFLLAAGAFVESTPVELEKRVEVTTAQNWCIAGGAVLTGLAAFAGSIAGLISALSTTKSCGTRSKEIESDGGKVKRDLDRTPLSDALAVNGFDVKYEHWDYDGEADALIYPRKILIFICNQIRYEAQR
jgi:hypothetical protein